jgi:hypothetical protein
MAKIYTMYRCFFVSLMLIMVPFMAIVNGQGIEPTTAKDLLAAATEQPVIATPETPASKATTVYSGSFQQGGIEVIPGMTNNEASVRVSVFPNPIKNNITLLTYGNSGQALTFRLSANNKTIFEKKIAQSKESIDINDFSGDDFQLEILCENKEIKSFRIVKH